MVEESVREVAEARLKTFWADAIERAGGAEPLAERLGRLGIEGRDGPYNPKSIEAWRGGRRQPGADVMFAVALDLEMSLDHYVFGHAIEQSEAAVARRLQDLETTQDYLLSWAMTDPKFVEAIRKRDEQRQQAAG